MITIIIKKITHKLIRLTIFKKFKMTIINKIIFIIIIYIKNEKYF